MDNDQGVKGEPDEPVSENRYSVGKATEFNSMPNSPEEMLIPKEEEDEDEEETVDIPELQTHSTIFPNSPENNESSESASSTVLHDSHDLIDVPTVLLPEPNQISSTVSLLHHQPVILTASALPGLLAPVLGSPEMIEDAIADSQRHADHLLITSKNTPEELLDPKTEALGGSCILFTTSEANHENHTTVKLENSPTAVGVVVTSQQTSINYLGQIFDHDQITSPSQMTSLSRVVTSSLSPSSLPELHPCKWENCCQHFLCLDDLVVHVNEYHIKMENNDEFLCRWQGCPRNGKGFNARYKMLIHMRTHTGERPHKCCHESCGKSFSRLENLKIHKRSHTGEKPYMCPVDGCNKRYSNSSDRFKHTRTHYETKPYHCKVEGCCKRYTDPSSLRKHLKTIHGKEIIVNEQDCG